MTRYWQNLFICKRLIRIKLSLLINVRQNAGIIELKYPKVFIDYLQTIDDVYQNLEDYNQTKQ